MHRGRRVRRAMRSRSRHYLSLVNGRILERDRFVATPAPSSPNNPATRPPGKAAAAWRAIEIHPHDANWWQPAPQLLQSPVRRRSRPSSLLCVKRDDARTNSRRRCGLSAKNAPRITLRMAGPSPADLTALRPGGNPIHNFKQALAVAKPTPPGNAANHQRNFQASECWKVLWIPGMGPTNFAQPAKCVRCHH